MQSTSSLSSVASSQKVHPGSTENLWDSDSSRDFGKAIIAPIKPFTADSFVDTSSDDHHLSFSDNGRDCTDFFSDSDPSNTQIDFRSMNYLVVPNDDQAVLKKGRSNSLTTGASLYHQPYPFAYSTENLAKQQRSSSLTDSRRSSLTSSGSEARLGDPCYPVYVGMGNIGAWLKGERLHKYQRIFNGMTYEKLLNITNEYLIEQQVTEGARNKLVRCIQALRQRHEKLMQLEQGLRGGVVDLGMATDELKAMVITPMKPLDQYAEEDVPTQFLNVLNLGEFCAMPSSVLGEMISRCTVIHLS